MSQSFGFAGPKIPHLVSLGKDGLPGEIADLRSDVELAFENNEGRVGFPELYAQHGTFPDVGGEGSVPLIGANLLQGQTFDSCSLVSSGFEIKLKALKPGKSNLHAKIATSTGSLALTYADTSTCSLTGIDPIGNITVLTLSLTDPSRQGLSAQITQPKLPLGALAVTYDAARKLLSIRPADGGSTVAAITAAVTAATSGAITVTAASVNGSPVTPGSATNVVYVAVEPTSFVEYKLLTITLGSGGNTAAAIVSAINNNTSGGTVMNIMGAYVVTGGTMTAAVAATPFTGGVGSYAGNKVTVAGIEAVPSNLGPSGPSGPWSWTDTQITVDTPVLSSLSEEDFVAVRIQSNGVNSEQLTVQLGGGDVVGPAGPSGPSGPSGTSGPSGPSGPS